MDKLDWCFLADNKTDSVRYENMFYIMINFYYCLIQL